MDKVLLQLGSWILSVNTLLAFVAFVIVFFILYTFIKKELWKRLSLDKYADKAAISRLRRYLYGAGVLIFIILSMLILRIDYVLFRAENFDVGIKLILQGFFVFQLARIIDWLAVNVFLNKYYAERDEQVEHEQLEHGRRDIKSENTSSAAQIIKYILFVLVAIILIKQFHLEQYVQLYPVTLPSGEQIYFGVSDILSAGLVILFARLILWVITQIFLYSVYRRNKIDVGAQYAINQLLKYVVYLIAFFIALDRLGINMTLVWGGAAALLVGIGLGLQQTFNDFFSGLVLLFERSVSVGDSIEIDNSVTTVKKIGLRSSELQTRGNMTIIVPNSQLVNQQVINWNHYDERTRFSVKVGAAYGSDTQKIKDILLQIAKESIYILDFPPPSVRLTSFGDSSLDFELIFFSRNYMIIEDIKSDLRFEIDKKFRDAEVSIPFPQRVVHVRKDGEL